MARLRYNGLTTTLGAALTGSDTAVTFGAALTHSGGAVPTIAGTDYVPLTILTSTGAVSEIVYLTAYTSGATTGTITRARESSTGVAHASGDKVIHSATTNDVPALVAGSNVTLTPNVAGDVVTIGAAAPVYRGAWSPLSVVTLYDFANGLMPAAFTVTPPPYGGGTPVVANGNGDPTSPAKVIQSAGMPGGESSGVHFTVPSGVSSVRWKWQLNGASAHIWAQKNGGNIVQRTAFNSQFTEASMSVVPGDVVKFLFQDTGNNGGQHRVGYIELLAAAAPYNIGQVVSHLGKLWRSTTDGNATTPGSDASWVEVLTGYVTDPEVVRDTMATALVAGSNVTITPNDVGDTITIAAAGPVYRGVWASDAVVRSYDFASSVPAEFVGSNLGTGVGPTSVALAGIGVLAAPGPGPHTTAAKLQVSNYNSTTHYSRMSLNLGTLGLTGITRVKFWTGYRGDSSDASYYISRAKKNGSAFLTRQPASSIRELPWQQNEVTATTADTLEWELVGQLTFEGGQGAQARLGVAGIEIYATADPFMLGQVVSHLGKLWRSTSNNNSTTPGVDASWVEVLTGYATDPEVVRDTMATALVAGTNVTITPSDVGDTITIASVDTNTTDPEVVRDTIAAALVAGSNVTITPDDVGDTITIAAATDPEIVRDAIGAALVAGTGVTITPDDAADTITIAATGGGGATTLDALTDVDTTGAEAPGDGYILTYDAATSQWIPQPGGGAVGSWENDKTVTFTQPAWAEFDLQAAPLAVPTSKPATPQISFTTTQAMMVTSSDEADANPIGFSPQLLLSASVNHQGATTTGATVYYELVKNGSVVQSGSDIGHTNTERGSLNTYTSIVPGDVIEVFLWSSIAGSVLDWWARGGSNARLFRNQPSGGGKWLVRDISVLSQFPAQAPTTTLTSLPGWSASGGGSSIRSVDNGNDVAASIDNNRAYVTDSVTGVLRPYVADYTPSTLTDSTVTSVWSAGGVASVRFDRLAIPVPPA